MPARWVGMCVDGKYGWSFHTINQERSWDRRDRIKVDCGDCDGEKGAAAALADVAAGASAHALFKHRFNRNKLHIKVFRAYSSLFILLMLVSP